MLFADPELVNGRGSEGGGRDGDSVVSSTFRHEQLFEATEQVKPPRVFWILYLRGRWRWLQTLLQNQNQSCQYRAQQLCCKRACGGTLLRPFLKTCWTTLTTFVFWQINEIIASKIARRLSGITKDTRTHWQLLRLLYTNLLSTDFQAACWFTCS